MVSRVDAIKKPRRGGREQTTDPKILAKSWCRDTLKMWPTIEPFLLKAKRRKIEENIRESTWMSNREEGTCVGRYDANKVDNTPQ